MRRGTIARLEAKANLITMFINQCMNTTAEMLDKSRRMRRGDDRRSRMLDEPPNREYHRYVCRFGAAWRHQNKQALDNPSGDKIKVAQKVAVVG
jgi:hypothetical protein